MDKKEGTLVVKLGEKEYKLEYGKELEVDEALINENLKEQASLYAWYSVLEQEAEKAYRDSKLELDITESSLDEYFRNELQKGSGKVTETLIQKKIALSDEYIQKRAQVNETRAYWGKLKAIRQGFEHRKDMLIALASNLRQQYDGETYLYESQKRREMKEKEKE